MTFTPAIQLLAAVWNLWQSIAADGAARLREECGLDLKGFIALSYLQDHLYSPAELAADLQMPRYEISRLLGELEAAGFVRRTRSARDGRQVSVEPTPAGVAAWHQGLNTADQVVEPYLSGLDDAKREDLILSLAGLVRPQTKEKTQPTHSQGDPR